MSALSIEQMRDLTAKLDRLSKLGQARDQASIDRDAANKRWNAARDQFAQLHAEIVAQYGEHNAPIWYAPLHGPQARPLVIAIPVMAQAAA